jgi:NADH-quinone oxidoreductase subunit L
MGALSSLQSLLILAAEEAHHLPHGAEHATAVGPQKVVTASLLWLIPLLPLLGSAINAFAGHYIQRRFGKKYNSAIAIGAMAASFATAFAVWIQMIGLPPSDRYLVDFVWNMFTAGDVQVNLSFALDPLSMTMTLIITFVGSLIHIYSVGYMADDPGYWRFFCYLNLFVFSMLLLVMGDNFALMFFGWEGVGLCSYLLIGFWYEDIDKAKAAVKAFVVNRVGDFGFVLGLFLLFWALGGSWVQKRNEIPRREALWSAADPTYRPQPLEGTFYERDRALSPAQPPATWEAYQTDPQAQVSRAGIRVGPTLTFRELRDQLAVEGTGLKARLLGMTFFGIPLLALVGVLLFIGATAKSAQIPLYVWLPDAMAGPTPVSALIHAATMVTAGIYMVARLNFLFALSPAVMTVIAATGALTAAFAATIGFVQNDIKKVLAYSTVSQLGFMFIGVGVGAYWAGVYHLLTHAFFKACLFLCSGSVILGCHHEQDMRRMGGLGKFMPLTAKTYLYACIAISGFPIANGFFSKDEILWRAFDSGGNLLDPNLGKLIWLVGWLTACGTSFYMWRSYYMTFTGEYRGAGGGSPHPTPVLATHSLGAAHAGTFDADVLLSSAVASPGDAHPDSGGVDAHAKGTAKHPDHPDHKAEGGHGHGGLPHESPRSMTYVLVALAVGCAVTVVLGFWPPLGKLLNIENLKTPLLEGWLGPVFAPSEPLVESRAAESGTTWEWILICASVSVAFLGWYVARAFYKDAKSTVPAMLQAKFPRLHRVVYNKYYVDEFYQATVIRGVMVLSRAFSVFDQVVIDGAVNGVATVGRFICNIEGAIDVYLVDGAVNFFADGVIRIGNRLQRVQSGRIQQYLYAAVAGALAVIAIVYLIH